MDYKQFKVVLIESLKMAGYEVTESLACKNNQGKIPCLQVCQPNTKIGVVIYPQTLFADGVKPADVLAEILNHLRNEIPGNLEEVVNDKDNNRDKVYLSVIGYANNKEMLEKVPHYRFLDLAYVFRLHFVEDGTISTVITNENMEYFGFKSKEELFEVAKENTKRDYEIVDMASQVIPDFHPLAQKEVFITNQYSNRGFVCAFINDTLAKYAEKFGTDLYILPTSIHEFMLVSTDVSPIENFYDMVKSSNENDEIINEQDILTTNVYYYEAKTKKLTAYKTENCV